MKRFRLLLIPFAVIMELALLTTCWVVQIFSKPTAEKIMEWAFRTLPSVHWYMGYR